MWSSTGRARPCRPEVAGADVEALVGFYTELFGWQAEDRRRGADHHTVFTQRGRAVAAARPIGSRGGEQPPRWTTYVTVANADESVQRVLAAGGTVSVAPTDVSDAGRMAVLADPSGGPFAIWEPGRSIGAETVNEPVSLCWNELTCRDADRVLEFYNHVFGWRVVHIGEEPFRYREIYLGDRLVAGCMEMDDSWPSGVPTDWMTYFAVEDPDDRARAAASSGGAVSVEPFDMPLGRAAVLKDPCGAVFSVIRLKNPS